MTGAQLKRVRLILGASANQFAALLGLGGGGDAVRKLERGDKAISGPIARCALLMVNVWPFPDQQGKLFEDQDELFPVQWPLLHHADPDVAVSVDEALDRASVSASGA